MTSRAILKSDKEWDVRGGKLLIVDDHELLAQSLSWALRADGFEVTVVPPATVDEVLDTVRRLAPQVVLLDLELGDPIGTALPLIAPLRECGAVVVIITGVTDRLRLAECVEAGAAGLLAKSSSFEQLVESVNEVAALGTLIPPHRRTDLLLELATQRAERDRRLEPFSRLTPREREVLRALMEGYSAEMIATMSYVSIATVRSQVRGVLQKLAVNSQLAAVAMARREGW